jgi:hypothetical protein
MHWSSHRFCHPTQNPLHPTTLVFHIPHFLSVLLNIQVESIEAYDILSGGQLDIKCQSLFAEKIKSKHRIQLTGSGLKVDEIYAVDEIHLTCEEEIRESPFLNCRNLI